MTDFALDRSDTNTGVDETARRKGLGARISTKLVVSAAATTALVFAGLLIAIFQIFSMVSVQEEARAALLRAMNQDLRAEVMKLQQAYFEIPRRLEVNPAAELQVWALENGAREEIHTGRDAIVARYKQRKQRRDVQKAGAFAVEPFEGGTAVSFGIFESGEYTEAVRELRIPGITPDEAERKIEDLFNSGGVEQRVALLKGQLADEALAAEQVRNALIEENEKIRATEEELAAFAERARALLAAFAVAGTVLSIVAAYFTGRRIVTRPLERVTQAIRAVASQEATNVPYLERSDEIGTIARRVDQFRTVLEENALLQDRTVAAHEAQAAEVARREEVLRAFDTEINRILAEVAEATQRMEEVTRQMREAVSGAAESAETARSASGTAANGAGSVSEAAASLDQSIAALGRVIDEAAVSSAEASQRAERTTATVAQLTDLAAEVDGFVDIISSVAHQTNLLALNATIEAARAGEMGKGFAVVAGEVKSLAGQTEDAAQQISRQVVEMRAVINAAAGAIAEAAESVAAIDRNAREAAGAMQAQTEATRAIAHSADSAAEASNKVNSGIARLAAATGKSEEVAEEVDATSEALSALSRRLRSLSSDFFRDIRTSPAE
ncbi:methyl-accepting chemotaxis protein [Nisaea sediminum]|uniref:methyl-accepting chemotaxis protein n=1 Tax=Nisaea sediminum TaxID=2775867 RepID=UPI0018667FC2|nr:HAMP domain-containing methyl-accepting chemotaxis protein [Nisaea sediminum]